VSPTEVAALSTGRSRRLHDIKETGFRVGLWTCVGIGLVTLAALIGDVAVDGLGHVDGKLFSSFASSNPENAGIQAALTGTLWVMAVCAGFIIPVGIASAIYLEEYADPARWWNRLIEVNIQNLAAVPSIVYGILGLAFLVRGPLSLGRVVLAGGLTLGLLVLPVVVISAREALRAVPSSIREGSMALGATEWQTIWRQVLPAAVPGIATGTILALARAIGETAPLILIGAATFVAFNPTGLDSAFTVLPLQIFNWISQPQPEFKLLAAAAILVLLGVLLSINAVAIWLRHRFEREW
jgi:phosphate transport system permease protein